MSRRKKPLPSGYHDQTGKWIPLDQTKPKKKKASVDKAAEYQALHAQVLQGMRDQERRNRGEYLPHEYSRCPDCLLKEVPDVLQKPYCFTHDWLDEGYEWQIIQTKAYGSYKQARFKPPVKADGTISPLSLDTAFSREVQAVLAPDVVLLRPVDLHQLTPEQLRQMGESIQFQWDCLRKLELTREFYDLPDHLKLTHEQSYVRLKTRYDLIRERLHAIENQ